MVISGFPLPREISPSVLFVYSKGHKLPRVEDVVVNDWQQLLVEGPCVIRAGFPVAPSQMDVELVAKTLELA